MKSTTALLFLILTLLLPACNGSLGQPHLGPHNLTLNYDDFGPEAMASKLLGPRNGHTTVIAHVGFKHLTPSGPDGIRYVNVLQSMNFLRQQVQALPRTPANEGLRQRLRTTYARLYPLQRKNYDSMLGSSFVVPQGGMDRRLMLPALPPPEI
jgi:hypothetical protein